MKNKKSMLIVLIIVIISSISGVSYGYISSAISNEGLTGNFGDVDFNVNVSKILPVTDSIDSLLIINYTELAQGLNQGCVEKAGEYAMCQLYKVSIFNDGSLNLRLKGSIAFENSTVPNLSWTLLNNGYNSSTNYTTNMLGSTFNTASSEFTNFVDDYLLDAGENKDYYILVWINQSEEAQEDRGSYSARVRFTDANGKGVTAEFSNY